MADSQEVFQMKKTEQLETTIGAMQKRVEKMADERRYIIYYTFGQVSSNEKSSDAAPEKESEKPNEVSENV